MTWFLTVDLYYEDAPRLNRSYQGPIGTLLTVAVFQYLEHFEGIYLFKLHKWCQTSIDINFIVML